MGVVMSRFLDEIIDAGAQGSADAQRVYVGSGRSASGDAFVLVALERTDEPEVRVVTQLVDEDDVSREPGGLEFWEATAYDTGYRERRDDVCLDGSEEAVRVLTSLWIDGLPLHEQWGGLHKIFDRADLS